MTATDWTDEKVERMKALWLEGVPAAAIARQLGAGVTRSAVLGKLHRLGVQRSAAARPQRWAPEPAAPARRRTDRAAASRAAASQRPAAPARPVTPAEALVPLATLLSVRRGGCRWPCGEPGGGPLPVCGRAVSRGAYCASHAAVSYQNRRRISLFALAGLSEG